MGDKKFKRQNSSSYKRVKDSWRKPKGGDSKMRKEKKGKAKIVKIGYKKPKSERGLHPSGYEDVLVNNPQEVEEVNPERQAIRIASTVGKKKKKEIAEKAEEKGIKMLNYRRERSESRDTEETGS